MEHIIDGSLLKIQNMIRPEFEYYLENNLIEQAEYVRLVCSNVHISSLKKFSGYKYIKVIGYLLGLGVKFNNSHIDMLKTSCIGKFHEAPQIFY